jgi:GntR family transcriptional regulator
MFKNRGISLYYQLENILREKINSGEYGPGDLFPTEEQLINLYKISRITVRQALSALEMDGLITRKRGRGSFVISKQERLEPRKLTGMFEDIVDWGIRPKAKVIDFCFVYPPRRVAEILKISEDTKVLKVERIRLFKKSPISYLINYVPFELGKKIRIKDLTFKPLLNVLEEKFKIEVGKGNQIIEATIADSRIASLLEVMTGAPLLKIERISFDKKDKPLEYVFILYRSDKYCFSVNLFRKKSKSKARWDYAKA